MGELGRYRKVFPRIWRHPGFLRLSKSVRELVLYLLCGPQTNRVGIFHLSVATASEDLNVTVETIRKGLADIAATFGWTYDGRSRVLYIPSWWRWNPPANANVLKGNLKDLNEIPPCGLLDAFARNLETLDPMFHQTFVEGCTQRLPEPSPIQDQDLDLHQKQKQKPAALRAEALKEVDDERLKIARQTVKLFDERMEIDSLIDHFHHIVRNIRGNNGQVPDWKRADIVAALNVAIAEKRGAA